MTTEKHLNKLFILSTPLQRIVLLKILQLQKLKDLYIK